MSLINKQVQEFMTQENQDRLRERIRELSRVKGYSLSKLQRLSGLSTPTFTKVMQKERVRMETLFALEEFVSSMEKTKRD